MCEDGAEVWFENSGNRGSIYEEIYCYGIGISSKDLYYLEHCYEDESFIRTSIILRFLIRIQTFHLAIQMQFKTVEKQKFFAVS